MIRLAFILAVIFGIAAGSAWLADHPGNVSIDFQAWHVDTSFAAIVALTSLMIILVGSVVWFTGWLRRELPVVGSNSVIKRQSKGLELLNKSLVALSAGDHKSTKRFIEQAELLLPPQPMVHLIAAEAATRMGDKAGAKKRFEALRSTDDGKLIGLRGLLTEARASGKESEALRLARSALAENSKSPWVLKTLFALEVGAGEWLSAISTLRKLEKAGLIDSALSKRHLAALNHAMAVEKRLAGNLDGARKLFKQATSLRGDLAATVIALVQMEKADNHMSKAKTLLAKAWTVMPHPEYITALDQLDPTMTSKTWVRAVTALIKGLPDHPASRRVLAKAYIKDGQLPAAGAIIDQLIEQGPIKATYRLQAEYLEAIGEDGELARNKVYGASADPAWQCDDCGHLPQHWSTHCDNCGHFDTLDWQDEPLPVSAFTLTVDSGDSIALLLEDVG